MSNDIMGDYVFTTMDMKMLEEIHRRLENIVIQNESNELHGVIKSLTKTLEFTLDQIRA